MLNLKHVIRILLIFLSKYLKINENLKFYKCLILNLMLKNVKTIDIEHLSNNYIFFKY